MLMGAHANDFPHMFCTKCVITKKIKTFIYFQKLLLKQNCKFNFLNLMGSANILFSYLLLLYWTYYTDMKKVHKIALIITVWNVNENSLYINDSILNSFQLSLIFKIWKVILFCRQSTTRWWTLLAITW